MITAPSAETPTASRLNAVDADASPTITEPSADRAWASASCPSPIVPNGPDFSVSRAFGMSATSSVIVGELAVRHRFRDKKIQVMALRAARAMEGSALVLEDLSTGEPERLERVDSVVAAAGAVVEDRLYRELRGRVSDLRMVGDCVAPRTALEAIYEGHAAGRAL